MTRDEILGWLGEREPQRLQTLWRRADQVRRRHVGDAVHLRGLIEFSNSCTRRCGYCGLRAPNRALPRYRMRAGEILACARQAAALGYGTVVLQSGEDPGISAEWLADVIGQIKARTGLAVALSVGERSPADLAAWRAAGADRYLLRFETANVALFAKIHPKERDQRSKESRHQDSAAHPRMALLRTLRALDYEVGSGIMIGIPGQTYEDLATDLELFRALDLDMIGVGPFLPHPDTPLGRRAGSRDQESAAELPLDPPVPRALEPARNRELLTYIVVALARVLCPRANIPSTTALATLNRAAGRELGLCRGANVIMPNLTPPQYRRLYEIYPAKACLQETAEQCDACLRQRLAALGRPVGTGPGASPNWLRRREDHHGGTETQRTGVESGG